MPSKKTLEDYCNGVRELYPSVRDYPDNKILHRKMYTQLDGLASRMKITIFRSPEEKHPWTEEDLGYEVKPMLTKKQIGIEQTADYQAYYQGCGFGGWIPFLIERKAEDLYNTLSNEKSRETFYAEIQRFKEDPRFDVMYIISEWSYADFLSYVPKFNGRDYRGKPKPNYNHIAVSVPTREATIAGLYIRGCIVIFAGSRKRAIKMYKDLIRQWIMKNYITILGLDKPPYDDTEFLQNRLTKIDTQIAELEESKKATLEALGVVA